jgi:hypothetical protein
MTYTTQDQANLKRALAQFTGSECVYRHPLSRRVRYSEGVQYLCETAQCYWLLDLIAILDPKGAALMPEMEFWTLTVHADASATLVCEEDEGKPVYERKISWTDFPLPEIKLWCANGILYLPSEH